MDGLELADRYVCIDLCGFEIRMAEHRLDEADMGTILEHQRCRGVAEKMAATMFSESSLSDVVGDGSGQP